VRFIGWLNRIIESVHGKTLAGKALLPLADAELLAFHVVG